VALILLPALALRASLIAAAPSANPDGRVGPSAARPLSDGTPAARPPASCPSCLPVFLFRQLREPCEPILAPGLPDLELQGATWTRRVVLMLPALFSRLSCAPCSRRGDAGGLDRRADPSSCKCPLRRVPRAEARCGPRSLPAPGACTRRARKPVQI